MKATETRRKRRWRSYCGVEQKSLHVKMYFDVLEQLEKEAHEHHHHHHDDEECHCHEHEHDHELRGAFAIREMCESDGCKCERGIVICTTGIGISISANKVKGVRCALCAEPWSAEMTRRHNDSNMLAMGGRVISEELMLQIAKVWLETPFSNDVLKGSYTFFISK